MIRIVQVPGSWLIYMLAIIIIDVILLKYWVKGEQFEDSGSEFNLDM